MKTFNIDEPREIGKKKDRVSSKEMMMVKQDLKERIITDNTCIHCGNIVNENLKKWFSDKWVNIGKKDKSGKHPECGTSGKKRGYAKCVPKSKAAGMSKKQKQSATRRKRAAQNKANRGGTDSTRGGGKKPIRVKTKTENTMKYCQHNECAKEATHIYEKKDACYSKVKSRYDVWPSAYASGALVKCRKVGAKNWGNKSKKKESVEEGGNQAQQAAIAIAKKKSGKYNKDGKRKDEARGTCWVGYKQVGMKDKGGKQVPNCVKEVYDIYWENQNESCGYTIEVDRDDNLKEAEYQGRKVKLGKPMQGDAKKFKVYVKNPKGNVVKVNFGQGGDAKGGTMRIRKDNPSARKSFRARHNCDTPGPRHKARYWSCRKW